MKKANKNVIKKLEYLLEELLYIQHDAFNCACSKKKKKTIKHILGLFGFTY